MNTIINIGELMTSKSEDATFRCFGLGSCIGVFLQDRSARISGAAHVFLPGTSGQPYQFKYGNAHTALEEMLYQFKQLGSNLTALRAKITGGANLFAVPLSIGRQNVEDVMEFLLLHKIYVAAIDVGGVYSRIAAFECKTGTLHVKIPQTDESRIY